MADVAQFVEGFPREALRDLLPILLRAYATILDEPGGNVCTPLHLQDVARNEDLRLLAEFVREDPGGIAATCHATPRGGAAGAAALRDAMRPYFDASTVVFRGSLGLDAAHRLAWLDGGELDGEVAADSVPLTATITVWHAMKPAARANLLVWRDVVHHYETILLCDGDA